LLKYAAVAVFFATAIFTHRPFPKAAKIAPRIADLHAKEREIQAVVFGRAASSANLTSLALMRARRMFLSSEPVSNVISLLQCWQFVWNPSRTFWARSRNTIEHFEHLIFIFSSIMECLKKRNGHSPI
jgi:hypothetical protein